MMGLPSGQLSNEYWFPWYNNATPNSMDQGFRIANVDTAGFKVESLMHKTVPAAPAPATRKISRHGSLASGCGMIAEEIMPFSLLLLLATAVVVVWRTNGV